MLDIICDIISCAVNAITLLHGAGLSDFALLDYFLYSFQASGKEIFVDHNGYKIRLVLNEDLGVNNLGHDPVGPM